MLHLLVMIGDHNMLAVATGGILWILLVVLVILGIIYLLRRA